MRSECDRCFSHRIWTALPVRVFGKMRTVYTCLACGNQWHVEVQP